MSEHYDIQAVHCFRLNIRKKTAGKPGDAGAIDNILISVNTDSGLIGWGCAAPSGIAGDEAINRTEEIIREKIAPALIESSAAPVRKLLDRAAGAAQDSYSARAAFDIAIYDLWSKQHDRPLADLLGGFRDNIPTSITVHSHEAGSCVEEAGRLVEQGFKIIKIIATSDSERDIVRIKAVKKEFGDEISLYFDCEGKYSSSAAEAFVLDTGGDLAYIEQPAAGNDIDGLAQIAATSPVPVIADESVRSAAQALDVFRRGINVINVKLMKCGGISEAFRICEVAQAYGASVVIGAGAEVPISISAAAHLALSHKAVLFSDLCGHLELDQHAASSGLTIDRGLISIKSSPGLGVEIRKNYLRQTENT